MQYVRLQRDNASLLENVHDDVFDNLIDPAALTRFLDCPRHQMILAVDERVVVGMISAVEYFHPDKPPQMWINEIGVATPHRKQGIGRSLMDQMLALAEQRGCSFAWLGTETTNRAAQACFEAAARPYEKSPFVMYEWDLGQT